MTKKDNSLLIAVVLIGGAVMYSRSMAANAAAAATVPKGTGSVPGNVGSGAKQIVGGIVSSLSSLFNSISLNGFQSPTAVQVQPGTAYDPTDPAYVGGISNLINGTISDYYRGDTSSYNVPTVNDIVLDVTNSTYGGDTDFGVESLVRIPGAYW